MTEKFRTAFISIIFLTVLFGAIYPFFVFVAGKAFFPHYANGSLLQDQSGKVVGSKLIGQNFSSPRYFHPRPSSAGTSGYDAMASGGSNLGPTSRELMTLIETRIAAYRLENNLSADIPLPADAVTASGSGLDPHISVDNAHLQAARVSQARNIPLPQVTKFIKKSTSRGWLGIFGEASVNVLTLNMKLDEFSTLNQ